MEMGRSRCRGCGCGLGVTNASNEGEGGQWLPGVLAACAAGVARHAHLGAPVTGDRSVTGYGEGLMTRAHPAPIWFAVGDNARLSG